MMKCKTCVTLNAKKIKEGVIFNHIGLGFCSEEHKNMFYKGVTNNQRQNKYGRGRR